MFNFRPLLLGIAFFAGAALASETPNGAATCPGAFHLDGTAVSRTATVFAGSRVETLAETCRIRLPHGSVELPPRSAVEITTSGFRLLQGQATLQGQLDLSLGSALLRSSAAEATIHVQSAADEFTVTALRGSVSLVDPAAIRFADLRQGSQMRFRPDSQQPLGLQLLVSGCLKKVDDGRWFLQETHNSIPVEMLEDQVRKDRRQVEAQGQLQPLGMTTPPLAARIHVLSERETGGCSSLLPFVPIVAIPAGAVPAAVLIPASQQPTASIP